MAIDQICTKLEALLAARPELEERMEAAVGALCRVFAVGRKEVAIFVLDARLDSFSFLWPPEMRTAGSIPFSANRSLVSTTASERRGFLNNSFSSTPHLFVFEAFGKERTAPIQKIMSVPMLDGNELKGVIQLSRKGEDTDLTLRNFSEPELVAFGEMAKVIARHL